MELQINRNPKHMPGMPLTIQRGVTARDGQAQVLETSPVPAIHWPEWSGLQSQGQKKTVKFTDQNTLK